MESEKPNVDALPLVWGANNLAAALKLPAGERASEKCPTWPKPAV